MIDQAVCDELHERLLVERERLQNEIAAVRGEGVNADTFQDDETDAVDQHPADDGSELFEREKNLTVAATLQTTLTEVEDALKKFEEGTYGICDVCGKPIPEGRLRAFPAATHCVEDQARLDRQARARSL